jgi:hypothetical protein
LQVVRSRQLDVDDDLSEAELVEDQFRRELTRRRHRPDDDCVFIPSAIAAGWLGMALGEHRPTNKASAHLGRLSITFLRKAKRNGRPGWVWCGANSDGRRRQELRSLPPHRTSG